MLSCLDAPGIVAAVSGFLYGRGANINHAEQHVDPEFNIFFQRVEVGLDNLDSCFDVFVEDFKKVVAKFAMDVRVQRSSDHPRVAILCSKQGHCLYDLLARWKLGEMPGDLVLVASNHDTHKATVVGSGYDFHHLPIDPADRSAQQIALRTLLVQNNIDVVVMARYMQILPEDFIDEFANRIINIHHSFLPAFPGGRPYHQARARGVKLIGATAHYATRELDEGPIIEQEVARVSHRQSTDALIRRGRDLEMIVLASAVRAHLQHRILVYDNKTVVFD